MSQLITNYDRAPLFLSDVLSAKVTLVNPKATEQTIERGAVLGRLPNGNYTVLKSAATDGSQYPKAILMYDATIAASGTATVAVALRADVNVAGLKFDGTDDLSTAIDNQRLDDLMRGQGLFPIEIDDFTDYDNQ